MYFVELNDGFYKTQKKIIDNKYLKVYEEPQGGCDYITKKGYVDTYLVDIKDVKQCIRLEECIFENGVFYKTYSRNKNEYILFRYTLTSLFINMFFVSVKLLKDNRLFTKKADVDEMSYCYRKVKIDAERNTLNSDLRSRPLSLVLKNSLRNNNNYIDNIDKIELDTDISKGIDLRDTIEFINMKKNNLLFIKCAFIVVGIYLYFKMAIPLRGYSGGYFKLFRFSSNAFIFFLIFLYYRVKKRAIRVYNELLTVDIMRSLKPEWDYNPVSDLKRKDIKYSKLIRGLHIVTANNKVSGILHGIKFSLNHLETKRYRLIFGPFSRVLFRGYFLEFELNNPIENRIDIRSKKKNYSRNGNLAPLREMDDSRFNSRFDVFCADPVEARIALTAEVYEQLIRLDEKYPNMIAISFVYKYVFVSINRKSESFASLSVESYDELVKFHKEFINYIEEFAYALSLISQEEN